MLSPESYWKEVPTDLEGNLEYRLALSLACERRPEFRSAVRRMCKDDLFFFINAYVWQVNPKDVGKETGPFILWDFQQELLRKSMDRLLGQWPDDMLWEKSREMGATWLALMLAVWLCLFHRNKRVLCISHSEQAVRKGGDDGTLFAKVQFILDHLPEWLKEGVKGRKLGYTFAGRSSLSGSAPTQRSGVGDRVSLVLLDEFSKQREASAIWGQTADTGPRLVIGTHYGVGTFYYELTKRPDLPKVVLHWTQHPEKRKGMYRVEDRKIQVLNKVGLPEDYPFVRDGSPMGGPFPGVRSVWYDRECTRRNSTRDVAMHLDIDPQGSQSQFFDPLKIRSLAEQYAVDPYWVGDLRWDIGGKNVWLEKRQGGRIRLWLNPDAHGKVPHGVYAFGADVSAGTGATPSCLEGMNERGEQVLEYAYAFDGPDEFAELTVYLAKLFCSQDGQGAKLAWEGCGPGIKFGRRVLELGYRNIYYKQVEFSFMQETTDTPGWFPSPSSKRTLLEEFQGAIYRGEMTVRSKAMLEECLDFAYTKTGSVDHGRIAVGDDPTATRENHGDRVIAGALMWRVGRSRIVQKTQEVAPQVIHPGNLAGRRAIFEQSRNEEVWV